MKHQWKLKSLFINSIHTVTKNLRKTLKVIIKR